jgi:hypothetical protein
VKDTKGKAFLFADPSFIEQVIYNLELVNQTLVEVRSRILGDDPVVGP